MAVLARHDDMFADNLRRLTAVLAAACVMTACAAGGGPEAASSAARDALFGAQTRHEYPDAVSRLERASRDAPDDVKARIALAYGYLKLSRYDEARAAIAELETRRDRLDENDELWLSALGARVEDDTGREIAAWRRLVDTYPQERWAFYELAVALSTTEEYALAARAAERALRLEPDPAKWEASWIYYLRSKALFRAGRYGEAAAAAEAGRVNESTWRSTYFRMALAMIATGDTEIADNFPDEYRAISQREGRNNEAYTEANLALGFYELRYYDSAIEHARRAYALEPGGYQSWALAYSLAENGQAAEALEVMERAAASFPEDAHVSAARGWTLFRLGRLEEALQAVSAAQTKAPRRIFYIERMLDTIRSAIADPDGKPQAGPWLG